jgi:5-bromo-4-chloroindolyl phosphate hydrolysis protein
MATPAGTPHPATLQQELDDTRRVLDDAQSALAQRDREIATANDDMRVLRLELDALRPKNATPAP